MNPIYGEHRKISCIHSFIFGRALTSKLSTARETIEQILFFAGASTFRNTSLTMELTCKMPPLHNAFPLCAEEYLFLALIYHGVLMGFCLCFVGLGRVLWVFVIVVMLFLNFFFFFTYPSYHEKRKRKKKKGKSSKLQNLLCFLGFVLILKIPIRAEGLCVT